jgi:hypothetical protein
LLDIITSIITSNAGDPNVGKKIMIYHDRKIMSGALMIRELLRVNNFLDEYSEPTEDTLCCICGRRLVEHVSDGTVVNMGSISSHEYKPARFVIAHSDVERSVMEHSLTKYNSPANAHGTQYTILIGSKIIKESYEIKDVQHMIILGLPVNIPILIQVFGRCIRTNSHINLPPEQRVVNINILMTTCRDDGALDPISPEMYRYMDKLADYIEIQKIEQEWNRNAIDGDIHRDITMPKELYDAYFPNGRDSGPVSSIGNLYFEPAIKLKPIDPSEIKTSTFNAYRHYEEEIRQISYIIKRLFMISSVWEYDVLWARVREPPMGLEMNPKLFDESNFVIALNTLVTHAVISENYGEVLSPSALVDRLFDPNDRYIYMGTMRYRVQQIGKYYIAFPIINNDNRERLMVDVETYTRGIKSHEDVHVNINAFVRESKLSANYTTKKIQYIHAIVAGMDVQGILGGYSESFQMTFLEDAIVFMIDGANISEGKKLGIDVDDIAMVYKKTLELFGKLDVVLYVREVVKYKDVVKHYDAELNMAKDMPIGYVTANAIRLYDPMRSGATKWFEVNKISMNRHLPRKDNSIIIGYFTTATDHMKFKLRAPTTGTTKILDTRFIERGIVCETKSKYDLAKIAASLGISVSKMKSGDIRVKNLCGTIKNRLIELEISERKHKTSNIGYLYSWWSEFERTK